MAALAEVIAHGGTAGAIVETLVALLVVGLFVSVWLRERASGGAPRDGEARLRGDDAPE